MYISRLCLQNYRCYDNFEIDFNKELTVIVAENGKGKTAILDAVAVALGPYLACLTVLRPTRSVIRTYARPKIL